MIAADQVVKFISINFVQSYYTFLQLVTMVGNTVLSFLVLTSLATTTPMAELFGPCICWIFWWLLNLTCTNIFVAGQAMAAFRFLSKLALFSEMTNATTNNSRHKIRKIHIRSCWKVSNDVDHDGLSVHCRTRLCLSSLFSDSTVW